MTRPFGKLPEPKPRFRRPISSTLGRKAARSFLHCSFLLGWCLIMLVATPAGGYLVNWADQRSQPKHQIPPRKPHLLPQPLALKDATIDQDYLSYRSDLNYFHYRKPFPNLSAQEDQFLRASYKEYSKTFVPSDLLRLARLMIKCNHMTHLNDLLHKYPELLELLGPELDELLAQVRPNELHWQQLRAALGFHPSLRKRAYLWLQDRTTSIRAKFLKNYLAAEYQSRWEGLVKAHQLHPRVALTSAERNYLSQPQSLETEHYALALYLKFGMVSNFCEMVHAYPGSLKTVQKELPALLKSVTPSAQHWSLIRPVLASIGQDRAIALSWSKQSPDPSLRKTLAKYLLTKPK